MGHCDQLDTGDWKMNNEQNAASLVQSVAIGATAAFGLTWWAWAAALGGAAASYHFENEKEPATLIKLVVGILAVGFAAAMLASALPYFPGMTWTSAILIEVRAGLLGLVANPGIQLFRRLISSWKMPQEGK